MRKIFDITEKGIDFVFRENNLEKNYIWESYVNNENNYSSLLKVVSAFSTLWLPDYFEIDIAPTEIGSAIAKPVTIRISIESENFNQLEQIISTSINEEIYKLKKTNDSSEFRLIEIRTSLYGWSRIILPQNVIAEKQWRIVDTDNIFPREYESKLAPIMDNKNSIWLRTGEAQQSYNIHLLVFSSYNASLKIQLGLNFFNPLNDPRSPNYLIEGIKIQEWQKLHLDSLINIENDIFNMGWRISS